MCGFFFQTFGIFARQMPCGFARSPSTVEYEGWTFGWLWFGFCDDEDTRACCLVSAAVCCKVLDVAADIKVGC